jgi:D-3-phosphoglycerate dehydrogenase / 2-oxoglutarate reductase
MIRRRVLVDELFPLEDVRAVLDGAGVEAEAPPRPWAGDDVVGLLVWEPVTEEDFGRLPALRVVATCSVGYDHVDLDAAARRGIWVCNVPDYCVDEMADSTIALLLALLRGTVFLDRSVHRGEWDDHAAGTLRRVAGTRLGIVGFGRIGRAVAARAGALGFEVCAHDPFVQGAEIEAAGVRPAALDELLRSCDAVSLHLPLTAETEGLIGARELALMPRSSYLVDTARARLLDWEAFLDALRTGHLAAAALDVLPAEPPTAEQPVPDLPNLIVTPHAAWYSLDSDREVYRRAALAVRAVLEGRVPQHAVVAA